MKKVLKLILVLILTLSMMTSSFVWVGAYDAGDVILDESKINDASKIEANINDKIGSSTITWNETTGRLHVKAPEQGAIEVGTDFAPTTGDAFTLSGDIYLKGSGGGTLDQGRVGLGVYSDYGAYATGWTNGFYVWYGAKGPYNASSPCQLYFEHSPKLTQTQKAEYGSTYAKGASIGTASEYTDYAKPVSFKLVVDPSAEKQISAYLDDDLVATISNEITAELSVGKCFIFVRNSEFEIDNLKITCDLDTEGVYDIENGTYEDGAVIINEQMIAEMAGADGNTNAIFGANSDMTWDGDKIVFTPSGNVRRQLINFPKKLESYTLSVDFCVAKITDTSATKLVHVGINELPAWANGVLLQFSVAGSSTDTNGTAAHSYFSHKNASGATGTGHGAKEYYNNQSYLWGTYINFTVKVDPDNAVFYVNNKAIATVPASELNCDFAAPYIGGRGGEIHFDNFTVYAGTGNSPASDLRVGTNANIEYYGCQKSLNVNSVYSIRFVSQLVSVDNYTAVGFKVSVRSSADQYKSVIKTFDKRGNTVYKKINGYKDGSLKEYYPSENYNTLCALTITDIPVRSDLVFKYTVTPYAITKEGDCVLYPSCDVVDEPMFTQEMLESITLSTAGMKDLTSKTEVANVYLPDGSDEAWYYSHHPFMTHFNGKYYIFYSSGRRNEDDLGQKVMMATSTDFKNWTCSPLMDSLQGEHSEEVLTPFGIYEYEGKLTVYIYAYEYAENGIGENPDGTPLRPKADGSVTIVKERKRVLYMQTEDGVNWSEPTYMRDWNGGGGNQSPERFGDLLIWVGFGSISYTSDLTGLSGWNDVVLKLDPNTEKPKAITESGIYQNANGALILMSRTNDEKMLSAASFDGGKTWTDMYLSNFNDYAAKFQFGTLPDGRYYYIGNLSNARAELVLMISEDGVNFNTSYYLGNTEYIQQKDGLYKGGNYGYPTTYIDDEYLHVVYSRGKEAVGAIRVKLSDIGCK